MKLIWKFLSRHFGYVLLTLIGTTGMVSVNLGLPTILGWMIDEVIVRNQPQLFWRYGFMMVGVIILGLLGRVLTAFAASRATTLMTQDLRNAVFSRIMSFAHEDYKKFGLASLTTRITTDAFVLLQFVEQMIRTGLAAPMMLLTSIFLIMTTNQQMGVFLIPALFLLVLIIYILAKKTQPISESQQMNLDRINEIFRENISGIRVVRSFIQEKQREKRFRDVNEKYKGDSILLNRIINLAEPGFTIIIVSMIVFIVIFGAYQIQDGNLEVGALIAFVEYAFHALFSLLMLSQIFIFYPRASVSARRLQEILDVEPSIDENEDGVSEGDGSGTLEFKNVYFQYPDADEPVLRDINFKAERGQTIAFIGSTGSGKSTIIQLIPRLYDITGGSILLDGVDIRDYNLHDLREKIGYTPQKAVLFSGSIANNLRYSKQNAGIADFDYATNISQAYDFIQGLEQQYEAELAEGGRNLSGGQRQRLSIARTIIDQPDIYIFDDSFSALDYKTDAKVRELLKDATKEALTFIVAQRISSITHADKIILLNEGEIVDQGSHRELLNRSSLYQEIARTQLSEEELNRE